MITPREKLLLAAQRFRKDHGSSPDLDIEKFHKGVEWSKDSFEKWLKGRRVPMLENALVFHSITGHISDERKHTILFELEQEKRIVCNHSPDGRDTWQSPEHKEDRVFAGKMLGEDIFTTPKIKAVIDYLQNEIEYLRGNGHGS